MKRFLPVIIGVSIGVVAAFAMISITDGNIAQGKINAWDKLVVGSDQLWNWNDVFNPSSKGTNVYNLIKTKLTEKPENDAIAQIAQKYGFTTTEAAQAVEGSITVVTNTLRNKSPYQMREQAIALLEAINEDYKFLLELFEMQQELDASIGMSQIFANGDISDSGFDLIRDIEIMEEILFMETAPTTVGGEFINQSKSPFLPTDEFDEQNSYLATEGQTALGTKEFPLSVYTGPDEDSSTGGDGGNNGGEKTFEILNEDICPDENPLSEALNNFDEDNPMDTEGPQQANAGDAGDSDPEAGGAADEPVLEPDTPVYEKVIGAPKNDWKKDFCAPPIGSGTGAGAGSSFGNAGFSSPSGVADSLLNSSVGAAAEYGGYGISAYASICLETELIWKTVVSYLPGQTCVLCEIDKIVALMSETLNHSLTPNKATGNLFESGKCKKATGGVSMQFIWVETPFMTPPNDDALLGSNMFEEWKKFADRYQPFNFKDKYQTEKTALSAATGDPSKTNITESVVSEVLGVIKAQQSEAQFEIEKEAKTQDMENDILYAKNVIMQFRKVKSFFSGYKAQYIKIDKDLCTVITNKEDIQ